MTPTNLNNVMLKLAQKCENESDMNKKSDLLYKLNSLLPLSYQLNVPSLLTDDYIDTALFRIYQIISK